MIKITKITTKASLVKENRLWFVNLVRFRFNLFLTIQKYGKTNAETSDVTRFLILRNLFRGCVN